MKYTVNKEAITYRILDGEAIIINKKTSYFYTLNKSGTFIWKLLIDHELNLDEITENASLHYQKNSKDINKEINKALSDLAKNHLLKEINSPTKTQPFIDKNDPADKKSTEKYVTPVLTKYERLEKLIVAAV